MGSSTGGKSDADTVVPLTGHVDRNALAAIALLILSTVVPLTGHVDRNALQGLAAQEGRQSCPSRGTWIEIRMSEQAPGLWLWSPSRATWIEIAYPGTTPPYIVCRAPHGARG